MNSKVTGDGGDDVVQKTIAIFGNNKWFLSIEMKTKVVQHVESHWMRDWKSVRVRKSESEREWESVRVSFEHRHENKNCLACPNDQHKHLTYDMRHVYT